MLGALSSDCRRGNQGESQFMKKLALLLLVVFAVGVLFAADQGNFGVNRTKQVTLSEQALVGDQVLPAGQYRVTHVMENTDHIMVFKKGAKEFRVKCSMKPLEAKANRTQFFYMDESGQKVLHG